MANLFIDFLHNYEPGTRRESEPVAYQYDEGHVLEVNIPTAVTSAEIHYWIRGMEQAEAYEVGAITQESDGTYTITGNIPNSYFETNGDLRVYIVVTDNSASIVTYEGVIRIVQREQPDDYVDDNPDNDATRILAEATEAADTATTAAETCQTVLESIPADYSTLSSDVSELKADLNDKADAILSVSDAAVQHSGLTGLSKIRFIGNSNAFNTARYATAKSLIPPLTDKSETKASVTGVFANNTLTMNGTASAAGSFTLVAKTVDECPVGTYDVRVEISAGSSTLSTTGWSSITVRYTGSSTNREIKSVGVKNSTVITTFTASEPFNYLYVRFPIVNGSSYTDYKVYYAIFPHDTTIVDTNETVASGTYDYAVSDSTLSTIDTMQHSSYACCSTDTKEYIDNAMEQAEDYADGLIRYITPEQYGAVGDGSTDDTQALLDCISASRVSANIAIPIRGFRTYKTTGSLEFSGENNDVYIHNISYTGSDAAVILHGNKNRFEFTYINGYAQVGSTAIGIRVDATNESFNMNVVKCDQILTGGNTVEFVNNTTNTIFYNNFYFSGQTSVSGNIFNNSALNITENDIYGKHISAENGYFFYSTVENGVLRLHHYCIETEVKYGITGNATLIGCRTAEFLNHTGEDEDAYRGVLFNYDGIIPYYSYADNNTEISYEGIKTDAALSFDDCVAYVEANMTTGMTSEEKYYYLKHYLCPEFPVFETLSRYKTISVINRPRMSMVVYFNHKAIRFRDCDELYYKVSTATFNVGVSGSYYIAPTLFDIDVASTSIYLDWSYCYLGINKFKVRQYADKKAIIYDKLGNVLFDGTAQDTGVYEFECEFIKHDAMILNLTGGSTYTVPSIYTDVMYDGTNEIWHIYKRDVI